MQGLGLGWEELFVRRTVLGGVVLCPVFLLCLRYISTSHGNYTRHELLL